MGRLPEIAPDTDRRWVLRVGADPYVRFDSCDYSLDPDLVGRRVEVRVSDDHVLAVALDTGETRSSFAFQASLPKNTILRLGRLDFLAGKENVVLLGPPGTGKTHLSIALGIRACLAGHRVAFRTATEWVAMLADAQRHGRRDAELDRLQRIPLMDTCRAVGERPAGGCAGDPSAS